MKESESNEDNKSNEVEENYYINFIFSKKNKIV